MMTDEMTLIDVTGKAHPISKYNTAWILGAGWIFFIVSFGFNCIFYKIHPSATDLSFDAIKKRLLSGEDERKRGEGNYEEGYKDVESGPELTLSERLRKSLCFCKCKKGSRGKMYMDTLIIYCHSSVLTQIGILHKFIVRN